MGGTAVENVPGGLVDLLRATATSEGAAAVRAEASVSAYARAWREVERLEPADVAVTAWRHYTWHGCWLALPDGTARGMADIGGRLFERPSRPVGGADAEDVLIGGLLTSLRDSRAILRPMPAGFVSPDDLLAEYHSTIAEIDEARAALAERADLLGHLDLLAADLTMRAGRPGAWERWRSACDRMESARDEPGLAAAALVAGDWYAAPMTSPLVWNCLPAVVATNLGWIFDDEVERAEFGVGQSREADLAYTEAAARYAALASDAGLAAVSLRRAYLAVTDERPGDAVVLADQARRTFERTGRPLDTAVAAVHGALAAIADGRLPEDVAAADLAADLGRAQIGHAPVIGLGMLCARMGRVWLRRDQRERATASFGLAERIFLGVEEPRLRAQTLTEIAAIAAATGDVAAARVAGLDALAADPAPLAEPADPSDDRRTWRAFLAAWTHGLASATRDLEGKSVALTMLREVVEPLRARLPELTGSPRHKAELLVSLLDSTADRIETLLYLARQAQDEGDEVRAAEFFAEARAALGNEHSRDHHEAVIALYEGDHPLASDAFERYLTQALSTVDDTVEGLREKRHLWREGLALQVNAGNRHRARTHLAELARTGDPWWAALGPAWLMLDLRARLLELEGDLPAASAVLDDALTRIESVRATLRREDAKRSFFGTDDVQNAYLDAVRVALTLTAQARADGDDAAVTRWSSHAVNCAERGRARALLDLMMADQALDAAGLPPDLTARWRSASAEVALARQRVDATVQRGGTASDLRKRLDAATAALQAVETELRGTNPRFAGLVNPQAEVSDLDEIAAALPPGTLVIAYAVGRRDLLSWAISADGVVAEHRVSGLTGLGHLVDRTVHACANGGTFIDTATTLSDLVLEPLRAAIDGATALLVVPAGPLLRLPFGVLPWNGAPLAETLPLTVLPSASALCREPAAGVGTGAPLVVGDPEAMAFGRQPAGALPGSRVEAVCVARLLPGATLLLGKEATGETVRAALSDAPLIHLATHGVLETEAPLASAVLLAFGDNLSTAELVGQRLAAGLVVLSACHTGTGQVVRNDELLGLGRTLLAAGARSAVVSLWAVRDLSAALLMAEFHRHRQEGMPDSTALKSACRFIRRLDRDSAQAALDELTEFDPSLKDALRDSARNLATWPAGSTPYTHPQHWAPFVLISTASPAATCP
ncbi:CHAT domain-containing protein [Lentzea californiensis]|uniref:CHAT domain-containing protein n=1 Tax=Lentzea californiensis TaxID=438851 RepID=UPI002165E1C5|nr:CHAT domain-containing protein [Lentzea californiensis]MCR3750283.1 CHAT domain-containing protein [Lentzea californiensis]